MPTAITGQLPPKKILMLYPESERMRLNRNALAWERRGSAVIKETDPNIARRILTSNPDIQILIVDSDFGGYFGGIDFLRSVKMSGMIT